MIKRNVDSGEADFAYELSKSGRRGASRRLALGLTVAVGVAVAMPAPAPAAGAISVGSPGGSGRQPVASTQGVASTKGFAASPARWVASTKGLTASMAGLAASTEGPRDWIVLLAGAGEPRSLGTSPQARFHLSTGNGYSVLVQGAGRKVTLTVASGLVLTTYVTRGRASPNRIRARFGHFGRVSVRFKQSGRSGREQPPKRCRGNPAIVRHGVFVGTIRFRGEERYVNIDARRAKGGSSTLPRWRCRRRGARGGASGSARRPKIESAELKASTPHEQVLFEALGLRDPDGLVLVVFLGATKERAGSVRISRIAAALDWRGRAFAFDRPLRSATVRPPPPFHGKATFERVTDGPVTWSGSLGVSLFGADVALTGPRFRVSLTEL